MAPFSGPSQSVCTHLWPRKRNNPLGFYDKLRHTHKKPKRLFFFDLRFTLRPHSYGYSKAYACHGSIFLILLPHKVTQILWMWKCRDKLTNRVWSIFLLRLHLLPLPFFLHSDMFSPPWHPPPTAPLQTRVLHQRLVQRAAPPWSGVSFPDPAPSTPLPIPPLWCKQKQKQLQWALCLLTCHSGCSLHSSIQLHQTRWWQSGNGVHVADTICLGKRGQISGLKQNGELNWRQMRPFVCSAAVWFQAADQSLHW